MKPHFRKYIYGIIFCIPLVSACDDYLEENPDNRVELNSLDKAAQLLTNAYSSASYSFTEWMSDNVSYTFGTTKLPEHDQAYEWEDFTGVDQDTPGFFWNSTYDAIAHANEVLAVVDNLPGDQERKNAIKGEALLTRAYGHFMLVNLFGKHYDPDTAEDDPGIPYVKEPETVFIKKYERSSVEEVYEEIEDDLLEGLELVNDTYYANSGKYHFTRNAGLAFASRFYLYKGELSNCIDYSNELLGADANNYIKDIPALLKQRINVEDYIRLYHSPEDNSNLLLLRQVSNFHAPNLGHWPTRDIYDQLFDDNPFGLTDERRDPAWVAGENGLAASKFEFLFERSSLTSNVGFNYSIFLAFRGEEVLLNRVECNILQNNLGPALADLQLLAKKRYRPTLTKTPELTMERLRSHYGTGNDTRYDRAILFEFMLAERKKEFLHEGLRWFDIKRFQIPVEHSLANGDIIDLEEDDERKVIQIPQAAIDVGGLEPNSR